MSNRLADAVSPYLLAHAQNPVDWHPWGEEAFAEARERDVPVFVSIGYATCHWCHVMARETFSDPKLAARLNAEFVAVKVDREEHPDVDAAYLAAASAFTRSLGWPLSVFTTPDGQAFFAGTYFPPQARGGIPSFGQILDAVTDAWTHRRDDVADTASRVAAAVDELGRDGRGESGAEAQPLDADRLAAAARALAGAEDPEFGGFGSPPDFPGPKFPAVPALGFLLSSGVSEAERAALHTLDRMAASALRDRVDGGFFRYGTRRDWGVPHYERMLYDNGGLLRLYADAAALCGEPRFASVAEGLASFLFGTLRVADGLASAQDSESEVDGVRREGAYYQLAAEARSRQPRPALDAKVLTGWNGLAFGAAAHAGALLGRPDWVAEASRIADGLLASHVAADGRMLTRASLDGRPSSAAPALEDYGLFARGLLDVFLATGEPRFAHAARMLVDATLDAAADAQEARTPFAVPGGGDPVLSAHGLVSDADPSEGAYPGGLSSLADSSRLLYALTDDERYDAAARTAVSQLAGSAARSPIAFGGVLQVATALAGQLLQLVVVTPNASPAGSGLAGRSDHQADDSENADRVDRADDDAAAADGHGRLRRAAAERVQRLGAGAVAVVVSEETASALASAGFGLFEARTAIGGEPTEYLCRGFVCELPRTFVV